jgi:hypothetical protein|tara:strand:+ start:925 stop:1188 length:264 start_codon:yes stop_codon:yes gene_type:complete
MRDSKFYITTLDILSANDMLNLEKLRKLTKATNKISKLSNGIQWRVCAKPRGPRTAPALADGLGPRAYDQNLPMRHALKMDIYIYER